eukprot:TRINITY_DN1454_c1_g1_i1.p1 TRINITY_DN1454_c1_g1~~TRINITY_DN1454_c1_g1_i1.p1  ORF type:complete len:484 (-),score=64.03 TRINITY_DN1454_c1_g1_i1:4558-6009(-)
MSEEAENRTGKDLMEQALKNVGDVPLPEESYTKRSQRKSRGPTPSKSKSKEKPAPAAEPVEEVPGTVTVEAKAELKEEIITEVKPPSKTKPMEAAEEAPKEEVEEAKKSPIKLSSRGTIVKKSTTVESSPPYKGKVKATKKGKGYKYEEEPKREESFGGEEKSKLLEAEDKTPEKEKEDEDKTPIRHKEEERKKKTKAAKYKRTTYKGRKVKHESESEDEDSPKKSDSDEDSDESEKKTGGKRVSKTSKTPKFEKSEDVVVHEKKKRRKQAFIQFVYCVWCGLYPFCMVYFYTVPQQDIILIKKMLKNFLYFFAGTGLATLIFAPRLHRRMKSTSEQIRNQLNKVSTLAKAHVAPANPITSQKIQQALLTHCINSTYQNHTKTKTEFNQCNYNLLLQFDRKYNWVQNNRMASRKVQIFLLVWLLQTTPHIFPRIYLWLKQRPFQTLGLCPQLLRSNLVWSSCLDGGSRGKYHKKWLPKSRFHK